MFYGLFYNGYYFPIFIYSFIGWLWETIYCSIHDKKFAYRGFLAGPYCPVYGFAVTTVLIGIKPFQDNLLGLFIGGMVIATVLNSLLVGFGAFLSYETLGLQRFIW